MEKICIFCNKPITMAMIPGKIVFAIDCPLCGSYHITDEAFLCKDDVSSEDKILFSGYIRNHPAERNPWFIPAYALGFLSDTVKSSMTD